MLHRKRHRIKQIVLKAMAVLITLCYIMEPAHDELRYVFHFISHNLKAPSYVLQHDTNISYQDIAISQNSLTNHSHEILDFIDKVIDSRSENNDHQGQLSSEFSGNKKIVVHYKYPLFEDGIFKDFKRDNFKTIRCLKNKGHSLQLYRPPQVSSNV